MQRMMKTVTFKSNYDSAVVEAGLDDEDIDQVFSGGDGRGNKYQNDI